MKAYVKQLEIRWADLDPNFHVLHSKYYDFGAFCRMAFLTENGITVAAMQDHHIGPIIFREECFFKREIKFGEKVSINVVLSAATANMRKWSMQHELFINDNTLAAKINIDGAWMDTQKRKLAIPPASFITSFEAMPKAAGFKLLE